MDSNTQKKTDFIELTTHDSFCFNEFEHVHTVDTQGTRQMNNRDRTFFRFSNTEMTKGFKPNTQNHT